LELSYDKACTLANYKHSANSLTVKENAERILKPRLELLKKNELRSPVVEKILNQMVNLVNCIIDEENKALTENGLEPNFHFDEIRIELARELKKNAAERQEMTSQIKDSKQLHEKITQILQSEFGIPQPTRKDIIRYKLYEELKNNGYHDLYSNTYIPREILFGKEIDVDHIIPQMSLFDDSFSNKTIIFRKDNQEKGNKTAFDYISQKYGNEGVTEFIQRITSLYEKGAKTKEEGLSKAKFKKLQITESEIGDGFIERDLRETQYIAKKAKNILLTICRHVVPTTGEITARLRQDWGLVNVMQEINLPKFRTLGLTEMVSKKDGGKKERITDWSKRNDHRHHAMDALTIAFTKHSHIQYLNHLNARKNENNKFHTAIIGIEQKETENLLDELGNKKRIFKKPMPNFRELAKQHLETVLISHNLKNKVVTKNKNKIITKTGTGVRIELTPRGQLHKETIYGKYYITLSQEEKVGAKFDEASIQMVTKPLYKKLLLERLRANNNDPKKAFTGKNALSKTPIYLDASKQSTLPEKVKITWMEEDYSIRKDITPDNFKDIKSIEKIIDDSIKKIITKRLEVFDYNPKSAFSNLDENPIWLNEKKGIAIKRVTISGIKNAIPLHFKKDNNGKNILDKNNQPTPIDFVSTGNNHHIAIYQDEEGNYHERVVSFFDAVQLISNGLPVIDKEFNSSMGWKFQFTMKQNELFVFPNEKSGFIPKEIDLFSSKNKVAISENLFRVQKISTKNYFFRHHLETTVEEKKELKGITYKSQLGLQSIKGIVKIRLNHIGRIVEVGEY
jgi:CRISPR-associated endonuclease Csn1